MQKFTNKKGFTLIELLVVISIIGLLSSVVLATITSARTKAYNITRLSDIDQIQKALELYVAGGQSLPSVPGIVCIGGAALCLEGTYGLDTPLNDAIAQFISAIPKDPKFTTGIGERYLYDSNWLPRESGDCSSAGSCPVGAYLGWVIEDSTNCGRGVFSMEVPNGNWCLLRIGDSS